MESKQPLNLPELPSVELPPTTIKLDGNTVVLEFHRSIGAVRLSLPMTRQLILNLRHAANALERQQRVDSGKQLHTIRRRASSQKSR